MKKYLFYISQNYSFAILRPVQKILWERGDEVKWFFEGHAVNADYLLPEEQRLLTVDSMMQYEADATLAPAQSIPNFLPGIKVAIFHGFNVGKLDRRGKNDHFQFRGCFDLYCTQGPETTEPFKAMQAKHQSFNVIETGWCALDPLFAQPVTNNISSKPSILFCSTFSRRLTCARTLLPMVKELSQTGKWQWIVQFHPKMDAEVVRQYKAIQGEHLTFVETDNVIPLLQQADIMVCDTSSVIPMFLVQQKPVVTYKNVSPGPHLLDIQSPDELEESIQYALQKPQQLMQQIKLYTQHIHPYQDGKSTVRVIQAIDDVIAGKYPVLVNKPLNFIRNFKYRKRLHYWKYW